MKTHVPSLLASGRHFVFKPNCAPSSRSGVRNSMRRVFANELEGNSHLQQRSENLKDAMAVMHKTIDNATALIMTKILRVKKEVQWSHHFEGS